MKLAKYQKELIERYENLTGYELMGKDRITDSTSFWEVWDSNQRWFRCVGDDVSRLDSEYSKYRPECSK